MFIDFHGLQYSVQQISYKSGQSIINEKKSSNIQDKIEVRPQGDRKNMGQGIERMPKVHRRQPHETTGRMADQPVQLSPQYKTDSIIVRWRKFDTLM